MADARANILITAEDRTKAAFDSVAKSFEQLKRIGLGVFSGVATSEALKAVIDSGKAAEQSANRLTAAFKLQGAQVGLTRVQLDELADSMAAATQFNDNDFKRGEAELLKFGNIYGDVFTRAVQLSADLAAFNGGDLVSAFDAVGKALANPIDGVKGLGAAIGKLSAADRDHIKTLVEQNKGLEAQTYVLDLLKNKIGGTADLMNSGYTKATEDYAKAWDKLKEALAGIPLIKDSVVGSLEAIAAALRGLASVFQGGTFTEGAFGKQSAMALEIEGLKAKIAEHQKAQSSFVITDEEGRVIGEDLYIQDTIKKLEALEAEYKKLYLAKAEVAKVPPPNLGPTQQQLDFLKSLRLQTESVGQSQIGALFAKGDELHLTSHKIGGPMSDTTKEILALGQALQELAHETQMAQDRLSDWQQSKQIIDGLRDSTDLLKETTVTIGIGGTPTETAKWIEMARQNIDIQRQSTALTGDARDAFIKAAKDQQLAWAQAFNENYRVTRSFATGFKSTMSEIYEDATNSAAQTHDLFVNAFRGMEDALVSFVKSGKLNFHDLADSIITDLIRIQIQRLVTAPLALALNGGSLIGAFVSAWGGGAAAGASGGAAGAFTAGAGAIPALAGGGDISAGMPYWVGERGPELVVPRSNGTVVPNGKAGGVNPTWNIYVDSRTDRAEVVQLVTRAVQKGNADLTEQLARAGAI